MKLFVDVACKVIVKNIKFETYSYGLQLSKKDPTTRDALKTKFSLKVSENTSDK